MFRRCAPKFQRQNVRIALSALCADVVSPTGKQPGGYYPPLRRRCHRITAAKFRCANEVLKDTLYYADSATELPPQKFRRANEVFKDTLY